MNRSVCHSWLGFARSKECTGGSWERVGCSALSYPSSWSTRATAAALAGSAGPRTSMSLIRWHPQSGCASLSIRMVRRVTSGSLEPAGAPLGLSASPTGPWSSNRFFQA